MSEKQSFANHAKFVPPFHFFVLPIFLVNVGYSVYWLIKDVSARTVVGLLVAIALLLAAVLGRLFALTVQDRVIRLEERLRLATLLPADLRPRIPEFTREQLIGIRFASDAELPALARKVLDEKIAARKPIKQLVKDWRADNLRA
jgi:hypothetical protein